MNLLKTKTDVRILASGGLVVLCILLIVGMLSRRSVTSTKTSIAIAPSVETAVRNLFTRFHLDEKSIGTKRIASSDGDFSRIERHIVVPPDFNTFSFNHALREAVMPLGANAIATEKAEDKSVTMHIKKNGVILQSLVFIPQKKEDANRLQ